MFTVRVVLAVGVCAAVSLMSPPSVAAAAGILDLPVRFEVVNVNRSRAACTSDGRRYTVQGHLTGPRAKLARRDRRVTLYVHSAGISSAEFRFPAAGYQDQIEMAELGRITVTIDRVGYGRSPAPLGDATCIGSQADMVHQIVGQLRSGTYRLEAEHGPAFAGVALAGHSFGSLLVELEAISFADADALVLMSFAGESVNAGLLADRLARGESGSCAAGGHEKRPGEGGGYAFLWPNTSEWTADMGYDEDPAVVAAEGSTRERTPCGEIVSLFPSAARALSGYGSIHAPALLVFGTDDAIFPPPAGWRHRQLFTGSDDVTLVELEDAGHTMMLEPAAPAYRRAVSEWLRSHGF